MKYISKTVAIAGVLGSLFMIQAASAGPINGTLVLGGTFTIGSDFLNFCASPGPCTSATPGPWNTPSSGSLDEPVGTALSTPVLFLTFTPNAGNPATPEIEFLLTEVFAGVGTGDCTSGGVGATCTPAGSAVTFLNGSGGNSSATITIDGLAVNLLTSETDALQIVLTSQFNTPYEDVLTTETNAGSVTNTYSASFTATSIPEPSSLGMIGIGAGLIMLAARRRKQAF
jgi:hypothetical protein